MKKWLIKDLEEVMGVELKRNYISFGIDIANKITGFMVIKTDDTYLTIVTKGIIDTSKLKIRTDRYDLIAKSIRAIKIPISEQKVAVVEMPFVGFNRAGSIVLGISAGVAYNTLKEEFPYSFFLSAVSARSRIGINKRPPKGVKIKQHVQNYIKDLMNIEETEDIIDGCVLALAGIVIKED